MTRDCSSTRQTIKTCLTSFRTKIIPTGSQWTPRKKYCFSNNSSKIQVSILSMCLRCSNSKTKWTVTHFRIRCQSRNNSTKAFLRSKIKCKMAKIHLKPRSKSSRRLKVKMKGSKIKSLRIALKNSKTTTPISRASNHLTSRPRKIDNKLSGTMSQTIRDWGIWVAEACSPMTGSWRPRLIRSRGICLNSQCRINRIILILIVKTLLSWSKYWRGKGKGLRILVDLLKPMELIVTLSLLTFSFHRLLQWGLKSNKTSKMLWWEQKILMDSSIGLMKTWKEKSMTSKGN